MAKARKFTLEWAFEWSRSGEVVRGTSEPLHFPRWQKHVSLHWKGLLGGAGEVEWCEEPLSLSRLTTTHVVSWCKVYLNFAIGYERRSGGLAFTQTLQPKP